MVTDPVCKMTVDSETATAKTEHKGVTYYFCCDGCRKAFAAEPGKYLSASVLKGEPTHHT